MKTFNELTKKKYIDADIIELKDTDIMYKVSENEMNQLVKNKLFPFTKGLFKWIDNMTLAFDIEDNQINVDLFIHNKNLISLYFYLNNLYFSFNDNDSIMLNASWGKQMVIKDVNGNINTLEANENDQSTLAIINAITQYVTRLIALFVYVNTVNLKEPILIKRKVENKKSSKKSKTKNKKVIYINQRKFIIDGTESKTKRKKLCIYTVEKWTNRGHYRTLKDGSKVWIKPCVKHRHAKNINPINKNRIYKIGESL